MASRAEDRDRLWPAICVVGAALIDLISYMPRLPRIGETLHGTDFRIGYGGKGANQAVMAAKLGARVSIVTGLGRDVFGDGMLENSGASGSTPDTCGSTTRLHPASRPSPWDRPATTRSSSSPAPTTA